MSHLAKSQHILQLDGAADDDEGTPGRTLRRSSRAAARREKEVALAKQTDKTLSNGKDATNGKSTPKKPTKPKASQKMTRKKTKGKKVDSSTDDEDDVDDDDSDAPQRSLKKKSKNQHEEDESSLSEIKAKVKSKKKGKVDSNVDYKSPRLREKVQRQLEDESSDEDEDEDDHVEIDFDYLSLESDDSDYEPLSNKARKKTREEQPEPSGRNAKRSAAIAKRSASISQQEEVFDNDDTPCCTCSKYNRPELILLCDKCDCGYHTTCLRPPLMLIPDGDWFCPPCEQVMLVEKLKEQLQIYSDRLKITERSRRRKERLAFVGITMDNIVEASHKEVPVAVKREARPRPRPRSRPTGTRRSLRQRYSSEDSESSEEEVLTVKRSCRTKPVKYNFDDFDNMINEAIAEDVEDKEKFGQPPPGQQRGKDMSNILGPDWDKEDKPKKRRLTDLDAEEKSASEVEDEEYKADESVI